MRRILLVSIAAVLFHAAPLAGQNAKPHELMFLAGGAQNSEFDEVGLVLGGGYRWILNPKFRAGGSMEWLNYDSANSWIVLGDASWRMTKRIVITASAGL